jgi:hypothetical protein
VQGLTEFLKSLGAARMAAMAAVTVALVGFFAILILRVTAPQMTPLFTDLSFEDSAAIVTDLERQGIAYEIKNDGGVLLVPKDQVPRLRMKLAEAGLPKGGGVGYEIFDKSDALGATSFVQNINHLRALEGELSRTIRALDRVQCVSISFCRNGRCSHVIKRRHPPRSVGGTKPVPVNMRVIATSNRNLADAVREGSFREDLLFRLNVVNLNIPPLRERPADITELAQHFIKKYSNANGVPARPLAAEARRALVLNRWPGNVRELENTLHRAVLLATGDEIGIDGIVTPDGLRLDQTKNPPAVAHAAMAAETVTRALVGRTVADVERDLILETLKHCLGNRTHAANILGISIRTLRNKLNEYSSDGVPVPPPTITGAPRHFDARMG